MTSAKRGSGAANAGRLLVRALVVLGGTAAACVIAWLTATASASTQTADEPGSPNLVSAVPLVSKGFSAAEPILAQARTASAVVAETVHSVESADVLGTSVSHTVPTALTAVRRIAATATDLTAPAAPAAGAHEHVGESPAASGSARPADVEPANTAPRKRSADFGSRALPVRAESASPSGHAQAEHQPDRDLPGRSWLPSCAVPASAGTSAGYDRGCGDVVPQRTARHPESSRRQDGVLTRAVAAAELQPGVTPD